MHRARREHGSAGLALWRAAIDLIGLLELLVLFRLIEIAQRLRLGPVRRQLLAVALVAPPFVVGELDRKSVV